MEGIGERSVFLKKSQRSLKETIRPLSFSSPSLFRIQIGKGIPSRVDGTSESKMKKKKKKRVERIHGDSCPCIEKRWANEKQAIRRISRNMAADNDGLITQLAYIEPMLENHFANGLSREGFPGLSRIRGVF